VSYVVQYVRVSTPEQRHNGTGFARQDDTITRFCDSRGWQVQWCVFEDVSGAIDSAFRVSLISALDHLAEIQDEEKIIVVENSSRWARDVLVGEVLLTKCRDMGIQVWSAGECIEMTADDPNNPYTVAIRQILAVLAQLDKANIVLRLKQARQIRRHSKGVSKSGVGPSGVEGKKPYGMLEGELPILMQMLDLESSGSNPTEIADELNHEKKKTRRGKTWNRRTIRKILKNPRSLALVPNYMRV
jgi:DNA invertase Pin-like site-specific DNA recombinase